MSKIKIGEHIKIIPGFPFNSALFNIDGEGLPLIRIRDLLTSKIETYYKGEYPKEYIIEEGDILIGMDGDFHIVKWKNKTKALLNQRIMKVAQKEGAEINIEYFYYFLFPFLYDVWEKTTATTVKHLSTYDVSEAEVEFPKFEVQTKIALILSTCDAVIEKTQAAIAKYKAIKQGMLQDLFTRGIDLNTNKLRPRYQDAPELYKESKLGMIPREWDEMSLEESTDYVDYRGKTPPKSDFGVFLVTAKNIRFGYIDYEISKEYIREDSFESAMSRGKVKLGDVLFTTEAPLGNVAQINKEDVALAQRVIKYRGFDNLLDNDYLALCLMSDGFQRQLFSEATGTTVLGIKGSRLHKLKIAIPRLDEQRFIVKRLKAIDNKLQTELTYLQKMQSLKKGLMEDLLSGRKCLNLDFQDEQINQDSKTILQSVNLVNQDADNYPVNPKIE